MRKREPLVFSDYTDHLGLQVAKIRSSIRCETATQSIAKLSVLLCYAAFHKSESRKNECPKEKEKRGERNIETSVNNQTGIWEVKPNVTCSTYVSFYSFEE